MASLKYDDIYSCFLGKITDYKFMSLSTDDAYELMKDWLHSAVSKPYTRRVFSSLTLDDEIMVCNFEIADAVDEYNDRDYGIEVITKAMVIEWLEPQVKSVLNISQMFGGKEQKFYAQSTHMNEIQKMLDDAKAELRKIIRDHGYFYRSYNAT